MSPPKKVVKHEDVENKVPPSFDRLWASQPAPKTKNNQNSQNGSNERLESGNDFGGFTQPAHLSDLHLDSQSNTQATQSNRFQRLVKRMTRFWVKVSLEETDKFLHGLLEKMHYAFKCKSKGIVSAFLLPCPKIDKKDYFGLFFLCSLLSRHKIGVVLSCLSVVH